MTLIQKNFYSVKNDKLNWVNKFILIYSIIFTLVIYVCTFLVPDFILNKPMLLLSIIREINKPEALLWHKILLALFASLFIIEIPFSFGFNYTTCRIFLFYIFYKKWYPSMLNEQQKIINSCAKQKCNARVAMFVPVCNDFLPSTILQTAKQSYSNMDVWIGDDSSKPDVQKAVDDFCKLHNFNVIRRCEEHKKLHPTKIGNIFYFLSKYGNKYDYLFENDSSSIITKNFVSNALCYFQSPLIDHSRVAAVITNGSFYGSKKLVNYLYSKTIQFAETFVTGSGISTIAQPTFLNGWGCMYKIPTLLKIPLKDVECAGDDAARGIWLAKRNYINCIDYYSFAGKLTPPTFVGVKKQQLKWHVSDVFVYLHLCRKGHFKNRNTSIYVKTGFFTIIFCMPIKYILLFLETIFSLIVFTINKQIAFNLVSILCFVVIYTFIILIVLILMIIYKTPIKPFIYFFTFSFLIQASFLPRRIFHILYYFFFDRENKKGIHVARNFVTKKTLNVGKLSFRMFIKECWSYLLVIFVATLAFSMIFVFSNKIPLANEWIFYILIFNIYSFVCGPLFLYIFSFFISWINVKQGFDGSSQEYHFEKYDFRYKIVSQTEVWKQQNKTK